MKNTFIVILSVVAAVAISVFLVLWSNGLNFLDQNLQTATLHQTNQYILSERTGALTMLIAAEKAQGTPQQAAIDQQLFEQTEQLPRKYRPIQVVVYLNAHGYPIQG